jgi:hypothetical protein
MMRIINFHPEHLILLKPQPSQKEAHAIMLQCDLTTFLNNGFSRSAFLRGECIACVGIQDLSGLGPMVWAVLSKYARKYMLGITRRLVRFLDVYPSGEIYATCNPLDKTQVRWLNMLGFKDPVAGRPGFFVRGK